MVRVMRWENIPEDSRSDMEAKRFFSLLERSQPAGRAILCFDEEYQITFISPRAGAMCLEILASEIKEGDNLPQLLKEAATSLGSLKGSPTGTDTQSLTLGDRAALVKVSLVDDPDGQHHCLIFERETYISSPEQLNFPQLSLRETEIAFWIYQEKTNWAIGKILSISIRTVEKHVENIFRKLRVNDRQSLVKSVTENSCSRAQ